MTSDYTKIKKAIQGAKHLTDAERDELVNLIWNSDDTQTLTHIGYDERGHLVSKHEEAYEYRKD